MRPHARSGGLALGLLLIGLFTLGGIIFASAPRAAGQAGPFPSPTACTPTWQFVNSPATGINAGNFAAVAAVARNNVWAVGSDTILSDTTYLTHTLITHWNGSAWSVVPSPNIGPGSNSLRGVAALAANNIWAVGSYAGVTATQTLIQHWNGSIWSVVPSPNVGTGDNELAQIAVLAADSIWAVGSYAGTSASQTLIEHWNGSIWSVVPGPSIGTRYNDLIAVAARAPNDIWAVGYYQNWGAVAQPLIVHWNGSQWSVVPGLDSGHDSRYLLGIAALAPNDIWAVGYVDHIYTEQTLVVHWDGSAWSVVPSPSPGLTHNTFTGLAAVASDDIWAVGYAGDSSAYALGEHWDGGQWSLVLYSPPGSAWLPDLRGVAALAADDIWIVGDDFGAGTHHTLILHYACAASPVPTPTPVTCPLPFTDVDLSHPFYPYIHCLYCLNIVGGYADNTFRPGNTVTRGQVAKFVSNAAGYSDTIPPAQQSFSDVPPSDPFWLFIERARAHGVISGYSDGTFRPGNTVTRGQMSKFVSNAAGYADTIPPTQQSFADVPPADPFWLFIERARAHGVIGGYSDGTFRPGASVTRGQASKFISNAFFPGCGPLR